jgi:hypothetical protein
MNISSRYRVPDKYLFPVLFSGRAKLILIYRDGNVTVPFQLYIQGYRKGLSYNVYLDNTRMGYFDFAKGDTLFAYTRGDHSLIQRLVDGARYDSPDPNIEVYHTGNCSYCGRELTDPVSLEVGIGPICRSKLAVTMPLLKAVKLDVP